MDISMNDIIEHSHQRTRRIIDDAQEITDSNEQEDVIIESHTKVEFYGLDILDHPHQADNENNYLPIADRQKISAKHFDDFWSEVMISNYIENKE